MLKKMVVLGLAVIAVAALSAPVASANWTHNGAPISAGTNPRVWFTGQFLFTSVVVGGANCQVKGTIELTGGTTTGDIITFDVDLTSLGATMPEKCVESGPISPCDVGSIQPTGIPWTVHSNGADIVTITTGEIHYPLEKIGGGICGVVQQIKLKPGTATATIPAGKTSAIEQVQLSGQLETSTGPKVTVGGTQSLAPANTYGTA